MNTPQTFSPCAVLPPHPANRLAVFIDIENFAGYCADMGVPVEIAPVLEHLSQHHGRIQIKRSFGDVSSLPAPIYPYRTRRMLQAHQIDHLDIPHRPTSHSKNSADIRLVVEAMALIYQRPEITHIVVVSNDRDFIPLFNHAREHGKLVIGCGPRRTNVNEDYRNACDVFVFHEDLVSLPAPAAVPTQPVPTPKPAQVAPKAIHTEVMGSAPIEAHPEVLVPIQPEPDRGYAAPQPPSEPTETALPARVATEAPDATGSCHPHAISQVGKQVEPVDCLLDVLRTIRAEGGMQQASRVAAHMKVLLPHFDAKKEFGSFKHFCIEQEKAGFIVLENREQPNFMIEIRDPSTVIAPQPSSEDQPATGTLLEKYREWAFLKFKATFPSPAVRARFYDTLVQVLKEQVIPVKDVPIPLQELSRLCSVKLYEKTHIADELSFRLCYGLFRGKAFRYYRSEHPFNPSIIGLVVEPEELDACFLSNTRATFLRDSQSHGLPLDEHTFALLLQGSDAVVPAPEPESFDSVTQLEDQSAACPT